jgi:hypothetical protein
MNHKKQIVMQAIEVITSRNEIKNGDINCPKISILICLFSVVSMDAPRKVIQSSIILEKVSLHPMLFKTRFAGSKPSLVYKARRITFRKEKMIMRLNDRIISPRSRYSITWYMSLIFN